LSNWLERLAVKTAGPRDPITALSGGNQQKVIIARALGTESDLVLLDDPTRGVDAAAKRDLLELLEEAADQGRGALLYSTEERELEVCDRVYVLSSGAIVAEVAKEDFSSEELVTAAFQGQREAETDRNDRVTGWGSTPWGRTLRSLPAQRWVLPVVALLIMVVTIGSLNKNVLTYTGITLLMGAALPLVMAAMGQMFVIALGDIDLGLGAYLGLVNVITVTVLTGSPVLGVLALLTLLAVYMILGALVHIRRLPAIVATLGASFVWLGIALTLLPTVGGIAPDWLLSLYNMETPLLPTPLIFTAITAFCGWWLMMRTRFGVLVRGFGNNPTALAAAGWSTLAIRVGAFGVAGIFGILGGLSLTAVTTSGDASAAQSYTLLSVTAAIMGGSAFIGGIVVPQGAAAAAVTLSFVGVLLSILSVDPNFTAAAVGLILILVLSARGLSRKAV
jgi:ribose transport system ATP-binding protein